MDNSHLKLTPRQRQLLKIIIEKHIQTALPVSSKWVCSNYLSTHISSATVRSECAQLEKLSLLEKVHHNSGRLPSHSGYRYYVQYLMHDKKTEHDLVKKIKARIALLFQKRQQKIQNILAQTSLILSEMLRIATAVTVTKSKKPIILKHVQLVPIDRDKVLLTFWLNDAKVKNKIFNITGIDANNLVKAIDIFNQRLKNTVIHQLLAKMKIIKIIIAQQIMRYEQILQQFINALIEIGAVQSEYFGIKHLLSNPSLQTIDRSRLFKMINMISPLVYFQNIATPKKECKKHINTCIGDQMTACEYYDDYLPQKMALISKPFYQHQQPTTILSLLGSSRINYREIHHILNWIEKHLNYYFEQQKPILLTNRQQH